MGEGWTGSAGTRLFRPELERDEGPELGWRLSGPTLRRRSIRTLIHTNHDVRGRLFTDICGLWDDVGGGGPKHVKGWL